MNAYAGSGGPSTTIPEDRDIPAIAAAAEEGLETVLARVGIRTPVARVRIGKYHPGERCTLLVEDAGRQPVVVKCYSHDPTPEAELLEVLRSHGLASGRPPTAAPLVACQPQISVLVTRFLHGPSARDLVRNGSGERAGMLAAAWLRRAFEAGLDIGEHHGVDYVLRRARSRARKIGQVDPGLGAAAGAVVDALTSSSPGETRNAFLHGSFYADHVLDTEGGPGIIDWDLFRRGPIESDAAMFLATLSLLTSKKSELAPHAQAATRALTAGMSDLMDARLLRWQQAAALLTLAKRLVSDRRSRSLGIRPDVRRAAVLIADAGELACMPASRLRPPA
jgi:aminoglycoside phosphotransferase (APT) family kinase protein